MNFKKANIIIVTLFVIILVGILGLLTTKYVLNLINTSSENRKYYKAYYIAYAGLELELLKDKYHDFGFEDKISSGSDTVKKNFTGVNYFFSSNIYSMSNYITNNYKSLVKASINCSNPNNWIKLGTGDGLMIPLYYDKNNTEASISGKNYDKIDISSAKLYYDGDIVYTLNQKVDISTNIGDEKKERKTGNGNTDFKFSGTIPSYDIDKKPFLVVGAITNSKICVENPSNKMITPYTYILSKGNFMDRTVFVKVVKHNKWASFSIYGIY